MTRPTVLATRRALGAASVACAGLACACQPPPLPAQMEPAIAIVAPLSDQALPLVPMQDGLCGLRTVVAVDLDNFDVSTPSGGGDAGGSAAEANEEYGNHWHLVVEGREDDTLIMVTQVQSATYVVPDLSPGTRITLLATLQDADHRPVGGARGRSRVEVDLREPEDGSPCP